MASLRVLELVFLTSLKQHFEYTSLSMTYIPPELDLALTEAKKRCDHLWRFL